MSTLPYERRMVKLSHGRLSIPQFSPGPPHIWDKKPLVRLQGTHGDGIVTHNIQSFQFIVGQLLLTTLSVRGAMWPTAPRLHNGKCASEEVIFGTGYVQPSHVFLLFRVVFQHI